MKVYEVDIDMEDFRMFASKKRFEHSMFNGQKIADEWTPFEVEEINEELKKGDFGNFISTVYLVNEKAKSTLSNLLGEKVEFLNVLFKEKVWIMNVTNVIEEVIDYEKADPFRVPSGKISFFREYAFNLDAIKHEYLFKIPELPTVRLFATEAFKKVMEESGLSAIRFIEVWDSEKSN